MKSWSEEDDAALRRMAAAGVPGSQVARYLRRSRDAVHGRARRLGVVFPHTPEKSAAAAKRLEARRATAEFQARLTAANSRLSPAQRAEVRRRVLAGEKQSALAAEFGVSDSLVSRIKTRAEQELFS